MRLISGIILSVWLAASGCARRAEPAAGLTPAHAAAIVDSVRTFMARVAAGVTQDGPRAWRGFFTGDTSFFMASEGQVVFESGAAAGRGIEQLTQVTRSITLAWGDTVRVDAVAPGFAVVGAPWRESRVDTAGHQVNEAGYFTALVEQGTAGWRIRNAHWSVQAPAPAGR